MFELLGKIIAAPLRAINVPIKVAKAALDVACGEDAVYEKNAIDDIADVIEEGVKDVGSN